MSKSLPKSRVISLYFVVFKSDYANDSEKIDEHNDNELIENIMIVPIKINKINRGVGLNLIRTINNSNNNTIY